MNDVNSNGKMSRRIEVFPRILGVEIESLMFLSQRRDTKAIFHNLFYKITKGFLVFITS